MLRFRASVLSVAVIAAAMTGSAQTRAATKTGHPNLQGFWTNATATPLERDPKLGNKEFFTPEEAAAFERQRLQRENSQSQTDVHYDNVIWQGENYAKVVASLRTSQIFDPPDGRIPPLTANGKKLEAARADFEKRRAASASAQDRNLAERCISWGAEGPPMLGSTYNANLQILQTANYVAIHNEMVHTIRYIPLDGRPHLAFNVRQLGGDSRGHWEGDTLIVDSSNFTEMTNFRPPPSTGRQDIFASATLHVIERFKRVNDNTISYQFTVEDPSVWTKPWTGEILMRKFEGPIYEYACNEGNYGLANILAGARAAEAKGQVAK
jgi:hypothetical protein